MNPFIFFIILLRLFLATAVNFTQVFQWSNGLDYEWPFKASRTRPLKRTPVEPRSMAVYDTRIFLTLFLNINNPVSLVSLPTSGASSASPKLTPFPSFDMHEYENCETIEEASGLQVDAFGRLWVLDSGSNKCNAKLWTIDLLNKNHTKLIHRFPFRKWVNELVLDIMPHETLAYISWWGEQHIAVFSLERDKSWTVDTPGIHVFSIALSPKEGQRQLYLSRYNSNELYSIPVATLRNGIQTANPKLIGKWTANTKAYRLMMENLGTMYAAFFKKNYISSWNSSQPFEEQRFHEVSMLNTSWPFTFTLDSSGTFWMTELNNTANKPGCRLLKAAVVAKSLKASPERSSSVHVYRLFTIILVCSIVFCVVLFSLIMVWLILRRKRNNFLPQYTNETQEMSVFRDNHEVQDEDSRSAAAHSSPDEYDDVGPPEPEHLCDDVAPEPSRSQHCEDNTSESAQYLKILP